MPEREVGVGDYVFESDDQLMNRHLTALNAAFDPITTRRLDECGVSAGWRCLDVGAGSGSIAAWLADRVGATGEVVATDVDLRLVSHVQRANLRVLEHDLTRDPLPESTYDLVHGRLLLILLPDREQILDRLIRALTPGGVLLLEDFDVAGSGALFAPDPLDAAIFDRVLEAYLSVMTAAGADVRWEHHLYAHLRRRGMRGVRTVAHGESWLGGSPGCELIRTNFIQLRERILDTGSVTPQEWARALELLSDEDFAMRSFLLVGNSALC